jgi:DNA polymerase IV
VSGPTPASRGTSPPSILHVDMDAFYASVELLRRPELAGRPVVVGGRGPRGVVAAASYEARAYGIRSAMPSTRAERLCPHAVFLDGDHARYGEVSGQVHEILRSYTPVVEGIALDEAFLDVSHATALFGDGPTIAWEIHRRTRAELRLGCSVGVAPTKLVAKLASEAAKPKPSRDGPLPGPGVVVVTEEDHLDFLHRHPVEALWGVGPATLRRLHALGVRTVGDLAGVPEASLVASLGSAHGRHLHDLAHGRDSRSVESDRELKSVGHEETFAHDVHESDRLTAEAVRMADAVAERLRRHGVAGRTVQVKVRFPDFRTITRSVTVPVAVETGPDVVRPVLDLLERIDLAEGVRLLGVSVSGLENRPARQLSFDELAGRDWSEATSAVDEIRERFGAGAIGPARTLGPAGLRPKRRGDQAWGPRREGEEAR